MTDLTYENFFDHLLIALPEFSTDYKDNVEGYCELLPHICMGDFTRFFAHRAATNAGQHPDPSSFLSRATDFLDVAIRCPDERVQNLVYVSFLENLQGIENYESVKATLSPLLRTELIKHYE